MVLAKGDYGTWFSLPHGIGDFSSIKGGKVQGLSMHLDIVVFYCKLIDTYTRVMFPLSQQ